MVLEGLGKSLRNALGRITGATSIDEQLIKDVVKDLQRALLQADVNVQLVLALTKKIEQRALEEKAPSGKSPKDHVARIIYEELVNLLDNGEGLKMQPQTIMMVGLYGQGKTTTTGKLANLFKKKGFSVGLIAADRLIHLSLRRLTPDEIAARRQAAREEKENKKNNPETSPADGDKKQNKSSEA